MEQRRSVYPVVVMETKGRARESELEANEKEEGGSETNGAFNQADSLEVEDLGANMANTIIPS